jgi:hypothetical protein
MLGNNNPIPVIVYDKPYAKKIDERGIICFSYIVNNNKINPVMHMNGNTLERKNLPIFL